jgi:hypothetical protein
MDGALTKPKGQKTMDKQTQAIGIAFRARALVGCLVARRRARNGG